MLENDTAAALAPFLHTSATLSGAFRKQYNDVVTLVGHVGSTSWPPQDAPLDPQVEAAEGDCGLG